MTLRRAMRRLSLTAGPIVLAPALIARPRRRRRRTSSRRRRRKAGWRLLFDGKTTKRLARLQEDRTSPSDRWVVKDGTLAHIPTGAGDSHGGGDIVTVDTVLRLRPALRLADRAGRQQRR